MQQIKEIRVDDIKGYPRNAKKHPEKQVEQIAESIRQFGMKQPILIDKNGVIVAGHGRYLAALQLGLEQVPCIVADDLTDKQIKQYRILDNKLNESDWDFDLLMEDLEDIDLDDWDLDFDFPDTDEDEKPVQDDDDDKGSYRDKCDYENLQKRIFDGVGEYGIPQLEPVDYDGDCEWIGFNYVKTCKETYSHGVHFFCDDYQFCRLWHDIDRYIPMLQKFDYVMSPDYSLYTDFPKAIQIYNHYRKHWCGAYMQDAGIRVIPTISWSTPDSFEWCFDGEPEGGCVAVSSVGVMNGKAKQKLFVEGYNAMVERLHPDTIILYGSSVPDGCMQDGINIIRLKAFCDKFKEKQ